jgi:hypothetical protein
MICPVVVPEQHSRSISNGASSYTTKKVAESEDVFPPKRIDFPSSMGNFILVIFPPDELDLGDVLLVIEFV